MSPSRSRRRRQGLALLTASATALTGSALLLGPGTSSASSHREAPQTLRDPLTDNTDVYAFVSPDKANTTTLIANFQPFQDPSGGPNFYPFEDGDSARYEINVDNDGDAKADITYRWTFTTDDKRGTDTFLYNNGPVSSLDDETLLFKQTYTLERIAGDESTELVTDAPVAPSYVGDASIPDYSLLRDQAISDLQGGGRPTPARPTTRSSSTSASSTCCTAATCPRPASTPWTARTSTPSRSRCPPRTSPPVTTRSSASGAPRPARA